MLTTLLTCITTYPGRGDPRTIFESRNRRANLIPIRAGDGRFAFAESFVADGGMSFTLERRWATTTAARRTRNSDYGPLNDGYTGALDAMRDYYAAHFALQTLG
jgi:hypothetical protein